MAKDTLRSGQVVTTFGPGALLDLPDGAVILGGLDGWQYDYNDIPIVSEPRLLASLARQLPDNPPKALRLPPLAADDVTAKFSPTVTVWEFPEWFVVQKTTTLPGGGKRRRMVHKSQLEGRRYRDEDGKKQSVVPIRFVQSCTKGHIDDIDWKRFVHKTDQAHCTHPLWIEERGTSGTLSDTWIVCGCGAARSMSQAARSEMNSLGFCSGRRPWLGAASKESCEEPAKLLIRSASNAYFPQIFSVISIPSGTGELDELVAKLWDKGLKIVKEGGVPLATVRSLPAIQTALASYSDADVEAAINRYTQGAADDERPVKEVEFEALAGVAQESGADVPNGDFYARSIPQSQWLTDSPWMQPFEKIVLVHRLREVAAQIGFTRFEAASPQLDGELDLDVESATLSRNQDWLPAKENRGEGIFLHFRSEAIAAWLKNEAVASRTQELADGFAGKFTNEAKRPFYGAPFYLIHSFSHILMTRIALECGYPASSVRERIYAMDGSYGLLIYTGSPDAQGTLGGLVGVGKNIAEVIRRALIGAELCSNDPVCSNEKPNPEIQRYLLGAACHGCQLVAETSCEWNNSFLDRELVVKTMRNSGAQFFQDFGF